MLQALEEMEWGKCQREEEKLSEEAWMKSSELESLEEHEYMPLLIKMNKDDREQLE